MELTNLSEYSYEKDKSRQDFQNSYKAAYDYYNVLSRKLINLEDDLYNTTVEKMGLASFHLKTAFFAYNEKKIPAPKDTSSLRKANEEMKIVNGFLSYINKDYFLREHYLRNGSGGYEVKKGDFSYNNPLIIAYMKQRNNPRMDALTERILITTEEQVATLKNEMRFQEIISADIETTGLDVFTDTLVGASFAYKIVKPDGTKKIKGVYLPCGHKEDLGTGKEESNLFGTPKLLPGQLPKQAILDLFQWIIDNNIPTVFHNAPFDVKWLIHLGNKFHQAFPLHDTFFMIKCYDERLRAGLKESIMREFAYAMTKFEDVAKDRHFQYSNLREASLYAANDAIMTLFLMAFLKERLMAQRTWNVYLEIEMPCVVPIAEMELVGNFIDVEHFKDVSAKLGVFLKKVMAMIMNHPDIKGFFSKHDINEIVDKAGEIIETAKQNLGYADTDEADSKDEELINLQSAQQVGELLFNKLKLTIKKRSKKTGQASTGNKALALIKKEHDIVNWVLDYRKAAKLKGSYIDKIEVIIHPVTGMLHPVVRQYGALSSRMSMGGGLSLQTLPRFDKKHVDWDIRHGFMAGPGNVIIEEDYCQMELAMAGALSGEPIMIEAFYHHRQMIELLLSGVPSDDPRIAELKLKSDLHIVSAAAAAGVPVNEVTQEQRDTLGKTMNFLILYDGTKVGLADILTSRGVPTTEEVAEMYIEGFRSTYKILTKFMDANKSFARGNGRVRHLCGRLVHSPGQKLYPGDGDVRSMCNSLIQGECAKWFKQGFAKLHWAYKHELNNPSVAIINLVHDATYTRSPKDIALMNKILEIQRRTMEFKVNDVHFSIEQAVRTTMSKADKIKVPELIYA